MGVVAWTEGLRVNIRGFIGSEFMRKADAEGDFNHTSAAFLPAQDFALNPPLLRLARM